MNSFKLPAWQPLDIDIDSIPKMSDVAHGTLIQKYYKLLSDNNLNPDDYEPKIEFRIEGDQIIISATPIQVRNINGIRVRIIRPTELN